jgi:hypothetical protein
LYAFLFSPTYVVCSTSSLNLTWRSILVMTLLDVEMSHWAALRQSSC